PGRLDTTGMKDLRSEIREFSRLFKRQRPYRTGVFNHAGVVVVQAVNIGPNLDLICSQGGSDERSGIVASAALQVINLPGRIQADKTLDNKNRAFRMLCNDCAQAVSKKIQVRFLLRAEP